MGLDRLLARSLKPTTRGKCNSLYGFCFKQYFHLARMDWITDEVSEQ
jgi:hypothetical protein